MSQERFSQRHGYHPEAAEISIRDDAPDEVRAAVLMIAKGELSLAPKLIREVLCTVLWRTPDQDNWSEKPVWRECQSLIEEAPWYRVYDFVEALHRRLADTGEREKARAWDEAVNGYFIETGVGWHLVDGLLESRGSEGFETSVRTAVVALDSAGLATASGEIHEALLDLSRRPNPDLTGAVQHAMVALECTARSATGDSKATLGDILKRHPDLVPKPLDEALGKMWGYASEMARHLREGRTVKRQDAELVVGVAASACTYLTSVVGTRAEA